MKAEIAKIWTEALRSGKYKQGKRVLRRANADGEEFCCLGVLCELAVREKVIPAPTLLEIGIYRYLGGYGDAQTSVLPLAVRQWADIETSECELDNEVLGEVFLTVLNDEKDQTFIQIADIIDSHIEEL